MKLSAVSSGVREFLEQDIPQVADLHRRVFDPGECASQELLNSYRTYFVQVFLDNPWRDKAIRSLVYEEKNGKISGFLGVIPRRMSIHGTAIQAAVSSNLAVDPGSGGLVGIRLLSAFLDGPQDLSIADEATDPARKIWEALGGSTSPLRSVHWICPLRPCEYALRFAASRKRVLKFLTPALVPFARTVDALAARTQNGHFQQSAPRLCGEALNCEGLAACLSEFAIKSWIRPEYEDHSVTWLLQRAEGMRHHGPLRKVMVKSEIDQVAGWYIYYANPGGIGEVLQLVAQDSLNCEVLDHLAYDAWQQGVTALAGRMDPGFIRALSRRLCLFSRRWTLVHSRKPELLSAFHSGDIFFSRLDGEWCLHFK
jgi:Acetyltransferase (GNAT) domain